MSKGKLPADYERIKAELIAQQESGDADDIFDLPAQLAASVTRFRHNQLSFAWGMAKASAIEPI